MAARWASLRRCWFKLATLKGIDIKASR